VAVVDESQAAGFVAGLEAIGVSRTKLELPEKIASSIDVTGYEGCGLAAGSCAASRIVAAAMDLHFGRPAGRLESLGSWTGYLRS
jgi:hypothetical protein